MSIGDVQFEKISGLQDERLLYPAVVARFDGQWVFMQRKHSQMLEMPWGKRRHDESVIQAARRITLECTGSEKVQLIPLDIYRIDLGAEGTPAGVLFFAQIDELGPLPPTGEVDSLRLAGADEVLDLLPAVQRKLLQHAMARAAVIVAAESYRHIIWDFNGTLIDDVDVAVEAVKVLLADQQLPPVTTEAYRELFSFPVSDYYLKLGFDFDKTPFETLCDRFMEEYEAKRPVYGRVFEGLEDLLAMTRRGRLQSILSAGAQWHVEELVRHYQIDGHFDHIFAIDNHFAASKLDRGRELIRVSGVDPSETLLIGDTDHDFEVGRELGIDVLLIADGHQSYQRLAAVHHRVLPSRFGLRAATERGSSL